MAEPALEFRVQSEELDCLFCELGAAILSLVHLGEETTVAYRTAEEVLKHNPPNYGAVCGRFANRISHGTFELDGEKYSLECNNGPHHLHGGSLGFSKRRWKGVAIQNGVEFTLASPDMDAGYPGNVECKVTYVVIGASLSIDFYATTDKKTPFNCTNHAYFNLDMEEKVGIAEHLLHLPNTADRLEVDDAGIPSGKLLPVKDTPFDFSAPRPLADAISALGGIDHSFVVEGEEELKTAAILRSERSGRSMTVKSTFPGLQVYTGNFLKAEWPHSKHSSCCLETQMFPDSPNRPEFPSTILHPSKPFMHRTELLFCKM